MPIADPKAAPARANAPARTARTQVRLSYPFAVAFNSSCSLAWRACLSTAARSIRPQKKSGLPVDVPLRSSGEAFRPAFLPHVERNHSKDKNTTQDTTLLAALEAVIERAENLMAAIDGETDQLEAEVAELSAATSAAEKIIASAEGQP